MLRILKPDTVQWLRRGLRRGELTRVAPGRGLREQEQWRNRQGRPCAASARKALPQLAAQLSLALPPARAGLPRGRPYAPDIPSWVVLLARIAGWQPSMWRPLPGNEPLWRAYVQLQMMVRVTQAARPP